MSLINSLSCQLVARFIPTCIAMAEWGLAFAKFICIMNVLGRHAFYKVHLIAEYNRKKIVFRDFQETEALSRCSTLKFLVEIYVQRCCEITFSRRCTM